MKSAEDIANEIRTNVAKKLDVHHKEWHLVFRAGEGNLRINELDRWPKRPILTKQQRFLQMHPTMSLMLRDKYSEFLPKKFLGIKYDDVYVPGYFSIELSMSPIAKIDQTKLPAKYSYTLQLIDGLAPTLISSATRLIEPRPESKLGYQVNGVARKRHTATPEDLNFFASLVQFAERTV